MRLEAEGQVGYCRVSADPEAGSEKMDEIDGIKPAIHRNTAANSVESIGSSS
ncbi:hypothetical protein D3C87_1979060 [compost metagenome]